MTCYGDFQRLTTIACKYQKLEIMVVDINEQSNEVWNSKIFNNFSIYKSGLLETLSKLPSKEIFLKEKFKKRNIFCIY